MDEPERVTVEGHISPPWWPTPTQFSPEARASLVEQAVGMPVTVNLDERRVVGEVVSAASDDRGVRVEALVDPKYAGHVLGTMTTADDSEQIAQKPNLERVSVMDMPDEKQIPDEVRERAEEAAEQADLRAQKSARSRRENAEAKVPDPERTEGK